MGVLILKGVYGPLGVAVHTYHFLAIIGSEFAGLMVLFGLFVMLIRKIAFSKFRVHTTSGDYFVIVIILIIAGLGTYMPLIYIKTVVAYL